MLREEEAEELKQRKNILLYTGERGLLRFARLKTERLDAKEGLF